MTGIEGIMATDPGDAGGPRQGPSMVRVLMDCAAFVSLASHSHVVQYGRVSREVSVLFRAAGCASLHTVSNFSCVACDVYVRNLRASQNAEARARRSCITLDLMPCAARHK